MTHTMRSRLLLAVFVSYTFLLSTNRLPAAESAQEILEATGVRGGLVVHIDHRGTSIKNQLGQANTLKASVAIIIGEDELKEGVATLKDMESGEQESVEIDRVVEYILEGFEAGAENESD